MNTRKSLCFINGLAIDPRQNRSLPLGVETIRPSGFYSETGGFKPESGSCLLGLISSLATTRRRRPESLNLSYVKSERPRFPGYTRVQM